MVPKESLNKAPAFARLVLCCDQPHHVRTGGADEESFAADAGGNRLRKVHEDDAPGAVPRRDGWRRAVARTVRADRTGVSEARARAAADRRGAHAADVLPSA